MDEMSHTIGNRPSTERMNVMNAVSRNRKAVVGIAASLLFSAVLAFVIGVVAPGFTNSFSAHASEVVTGQQSPVQLVINSTSSGVGVLSNK